MRLALVAVVVLGLVASSAASLSSGFGSQATGAAEAGDRDFTKCERLVAELAADGRGAGWISGEGPVVGRLLALHAEIQAPVERWMGEFGSLRSSPVASQVVVIISGAAMIAVGLGRAVVVSLLRYRGAGIALIGGAYAVACGVLGGWLAATSRLPLAVDVAGVGCGAFAGLAVYGVQRMKGEWADGVVAGLADRSPYTQYLTALISLSILSATLVSSLVNVALGAPLGASSAAVVILFCVFVVEDLIVLIRVRTGVVPADDPFEFGGLISLRVMVDEDGALVRPPLLATPVLIEGLLVLAVLWRLAPVLEHPPTINVIGGAGSVLAYYGLSARPSSTRIMTFVHMGCLVGLAGLSHVFLGAATIVPSLVFALGIGIDFVADRARHRTEADTVMRVAAMYAVREVARLLSDPYLVGAAAVGLLAFALSWRTVVLRTSRWYKFAPFVPIVECVVVAGVAPLPRFLGFLPTFSLAALVSMVIYFMVTCGEDPTSATVWALSVAGILLLGDGWLVPPGFTIEFHAAALCATGLVSAMMLADYHAGSMARNAPALFFLALSFVAIRAFRVYLAYPVLLVGVAFFAMFWHERSRSHTGWRPVLMVYFVGLMLLGVVTRANLAVAAASAFVVGSLVHYARTLFRNSFLFPLVLSLSGVLLIYGGLQYQAHQDQMLAWLLGVLPARLVAVLGADDE